MTSTLPLAFSLILPLVVEGTFSVAAIQPNIAYSTTTGGGREAGQMLSGLPGIKCM